MDNILKNKTAILSIVLLLVAFFAYSVFFGSEPVEEIAPETRATGGEIVGLAEELSDISFRQDVFNQPGYRYLVDFSTSLTPQPMGRANPFGPLGR